MQSDYSAIIIVDNDQYTIAKMIALTVRSGAYHMQSDDAPIGYQATCKIHNQPVLLISDIDDITDTLDFCPRCAAGEPAIEPQHDPLVEMLMARKVGTFLFGNRRVAIAQPVKAPSGFCAPSRAAQLTGAYDRERCAADMRRAYLGR